MSILSRNPHSYTHTLRAGKWEINISPTTQYGYFEHATHGEGGGLWFEDNKLTDYDGVSELPGLIALALERAGYDVSYLTA